MKKLSTWYFFLRILFSVVIAVSAAGTISGQTPTITSFTPTSGQIGTTVTITGTNFGTTAANNIVWFGAVKATVTAATATQLTVAVPIGATYQPINVTNIITGLSAYSNAPFNVTFPSSQIIDATTLTAKVDFTTGTAPYNAAIGDIDGDGKPDLAIANYTNNTISVYRNISSSGSITAGSFAAKVDFTTGTNPFYAAIVDIDGDGKPDLTVSNFGSNTVSIYRNISTPGSITSGSFASKVDFATGTGPEYFAIGDLDGDGKPDLVITNTGSNTVSVFRNTSTSGTISTGSFTSKVDFTTGTNPYGIVIGDIDGDGKSDITVANMGSNSISVFRNISSAGSITISSLASKVDFTTGTSPQSVAIGDIDSDGKPDLVVPNGTGNSVSVFRNTSSSGSITAASLTAKVDFVTAIYPVYVAISDIDGDGKPDLAVTNSSSNTVSIFRNISTSGSITTSSFTTKVDFTTGTNPCGVVIDDIDGDGKPDVTVVNHGSNTVSLLRNTITGPPYVISFSPTSGPIGTTVTITGNNFNTTAANNIVWFGAAKATVTAATTTSLSVTVPTGATYQPISVTVNGSTDYSCVPFSVTFSSSQVIDATTFAAKVDFITGTTPYFPALADIDGDGKPDLASDNNNSNTVSVFRNTSTSGSITAGSLSTKVDFTTGTNPQCITIGDIDGDGKPDLVVTNYNSNTVSVFRNTSTSGLITAGSFATKVDFTTALGPVGVAIGDIDGDGKPDLAVAAYSNTVSVFRNTSTSGTITTSSFATKVDFTTGNTSISVAIGDIDGDGKPDLAVTNYSSNTVSVFRNTSTSGSITTGSFAARVDFNTGTGPQGIAIGDIDGDGKQDLAVINYTSNTVSIFRNTSTSGSITTSSFAARVDFTTGAGPFNVAIGDIDGDSKPDLAVTNSTSNTVSVFKNTSNSGSITTSSFATKVDLTTGTGPYGVVIGDIDGDGKPDLVVSNITSNTLSILRNTITAPIPPTITSFSPTSGPIGTTVTITGTNFSTTTTNNIVWFGAVKATVTAATSTSLSVTLPIGATYQPISVTVNGSTDYSSAPFSVTFPSSQVIDATVFATKVDFTPGTSPYYAAIGDIDGDGKPDLVITNNASNTISVFRNISSSGSIVAGSFATKVDFTTGTNPMGVTIGDIDGDGKPDLAVTNGGSNTVSIFRNTSTSGTITSSSLAAKVDFATGTSPSIIAINDIDGDGKPDLVVTNNGSNTASVFRNTSTSGSITTGSFTAKVDFATGSAPFFVAIGDIDGDGKPDLVVTNVSSNSASVFRNISTSGSITTSSFASKVDFITGNNPWGVIIGDLDGDGKYDLAVSNNNSSTISLFRNTSTSGSITISSFAAKVDFASGANPQGIQICDIDGDGKPDVTVSNIGSNTVSIFRNISTSGSITVSSFAAKVDFTTGNGPEDVVVGDIDGDGKPDIVIPNYFSSTVSVLRNTITAPLPPTITSFTPTSGPIGTTVTITGTNFSITAANNIVWFGAVKATVTAATSTSLSVIVPTGATYQPISVNVTGNTAYSSAPFSVTFPSTRIIDATTFAAKVDFSSGTYPYGVALGDIDGDGKPDLVVTNNTSNSISVYRNISSSGSITAGSFASKVDFTSGAGPFGITIGDIDGDGKLDLAVTNNGGSSVSVFRNTSTSGAITSGSFAAKVDFTTGTNPYGVIIGDIDGDGKPELAVANYSSNTVSVFRNSSTSGSITTSSFAAKVDFTTGTNPYYAAIGDIDGDGKPDLAVTNYNSNTVSIFRNTSSLGSIGTGSFAAKVDFATGTLPTCVAVGDIDGDGKPDLAVTDNSASSVSVFRNTSTSGSITSGSFATKVDFTTGTGPMNVAIGDIDGDGKPDLAVTNWTSATVSVFRNTSTSGSIVAGSFTARVDFTTAANPWAVNIGDIDGDGKPDLAVINNGSNTVSVMRNTIGAAVLPTITSFTPTSGPIGTTVTITGTNFSTTAANNVVWFGAVKATVTAANSTSLSVLVPTGATYQPISVTVTGNTAYTNAPFNVVFQSSQIIDATAFATKVDFSAGTPNYVAIGDIDGDGKPDLAFSNTSNNTVSVFRNISTSGSVTAGSFAAKVDFPTGVMPQGVAISDIDGDGKLDLVVVNYTSNTVSVLRNTSSSGSITTGSFATKVDFTTGTSPNSVVIGDIDGDGKPDLAVANNASNSVSVLRNTSTSGSITTGSFAAKVDFTTGTWPFIIAIGDIDGDGKPDLAVTNNTASSVSVLRNTSTSGTITTGSFASKVDFTTGANPTGISIGDIDGDSKPDLVVTSNGVSVFRNTSTSGSISSGSFAAKVDFITGTGPISIAISDIDGDGKPDIGVANNGSNTLSILKNTSTFGSIATGSFATKVDFTTGTNPQNVAIGDIDGDGKPDIVVINYISNTVSVLRNIITAPVPPVITSLTPTSGPIGTFVTITGTNFSTTAANNFVWFGAVQATVSAATSTALSVQVPTGATYSPITVTVNGLTEYSNAPFTVTFPSSQVIDATSFATTFDFTTGTSPSYAVIGDIDGDGKPDMAVTNWTSNTISVFRNTSTSGTIAAGSFTSKVDFATGTNPYHIAIGDIDGDGKPDLVVTNYGDSTISVYRNTSTSGSITTGSFAAKVNFTTGTNPNYVAIGDIDGDGKPDLAVTNETDNTISVFRNTGTPGYITSGSLAARVNFTTGTAPYKVVIGDIDGDGIPDLTVANYTDNTLSIFRNTSTSGSITTSSLAAKVDFTTGTGPVDIVIGDIDGDGKPDLASSNYAGNTVSVFRNTSSSGSITSGSFAAKVDFTTGTGPNAVAIGDINGDGKPDLAASNYTSSTVSLFRNTGSSGSITTNSLANKIDFTTGSGPWDVKIGDIDGDGKPDLSVVNSDINTFTVFRNTMATPLPPTISSFTPTSGPIGTAVTITGTNFSTTAANNIVWFGAVQATATASTATQLTVTVPTGATYQPITVTVNGLTAYTSAPFSVTFPSTRIIDATAFATKVDFTTGTGPYGAAVGDIDGDGKPDLIVPNINSTNISVYRNISTSGSITTGSFAAKVDFTTGTGPSGVAVGDLDGDGKPDIAVIYYSSNTVSVFRNISTSGSITTSSLATKVDFVTGTNPSGLAIGDLDGDGKPDIVVTNNSSNTISVFRNISTTGSLSTSSFAARVDIISGSGPTEISVRDLDGDGKPDLAVVNDGANTVSVFRNISTSGSITTSSFAAKVDFNTGSGPWGIGIGDVDGDGKPDMAVTNQTGNSVSVFRNTSTAGSITASSFATKIDFTTGTTPFEVAFGDMDGDGKPEMIVQNYASNSVSVFRNTSISGSVTTSSFSSKVDFTAGTSPVAGAVCDFDGDGRLDIAVANSGSSTVSVLRNTISPPVPPVITSFAPTSGPIGTTVTITGTNFSTTAANNIVWFGAVQATVTAATATQLTVNVPTGATYQPITVTVNGLTDYSATPFTVTFASSQVIDATAFATKVDFTTGTNPTCTAIGDIDGDGKPDIVVANSTSSTVSVYRNTSSSGSITAGSFAAKVDFTSGTNPYGVVIGDIDGDGKPDLVVVNNNNSGSISVFRNTSTSGSITTSSFSAKVDFAAGANPIGAAIGDIDGDGKPDLAVANLSGNTISVFRNTSTSGAITTGSFAAKVDFTTGSSPTGLTIVDIDGDGKPELAVTNSGSSSISVFRNTSTSGSVTTGSFASKVDFTTGTGPYNLVFGDIDGDGKPDLAVANQSGNTVSVFRNTSTSGSITTGSFAAKVDFATGTSPYCITIGDIDGDGKPDLAVPNYTGNTISVIKNTSTSGSITTSSFATKVDFTTGSNPFAVILCDMDGDGKPDLAITNYTSSSISVLRNTISGPPIISSFAPAYGPVGTAVTITGNNFSATAANNAVWFGAVKATVTATTTTQLTVTVPIGTTYQPVTITVNGLSAYSRSPFAVTFPSSQVIDATALATKVDFTTGTYPYFAALSDIDGDGKSDLIVANFSSATISVYRNTSTSGAISASSFATKVDFATGTNPQGIAIGDIDGDGKPDIAVTNYGSSTVSVFRNTSTSGSITSSSLSTKVDFTTGSAPVSVVIGDIDGDGKPDLAVTSGSNVVAVLRNTSTSGSISAGSFAAKVDFATGTNPQGIAFGDIDGDGKPDLAVTNISGNTVSVFRNTSTSGSIGTGSFATKIDFTTGTGPRDVALGDIDSDGKPDLVVTNYSTSSGNTVSVLRNTSTSGSISASSFSSKVDFTSGTGPYSVAIGDINGDGKPDLAVTNETSSTVSVFRNTSTSGTITISSFASKVDFTTGSSPRYVAIGDIDGDGKPDLSVSNTTSNSVSVLRNAIALTALPSVTSFSPTSGPIGTTLTITGTNFSTTAANNIVWFGAVKATVTAATATQLTVTVPTGTTYQPITVTVGGLTAYSSVPFTVTFTSSQVIDATAFAAKFDFATGTNPTYATIGDIDGDGKPDLVVANYTSNSVSVYRNTSTSGSISAGSFAAKVDFTTGTGPAILVIGDIDCDGKPDLAVTNYGSNTVSVFRNTSTSGSITLSSFAAKVDFNTGTNPSYITIGDFDGDGKPDLAVANNGSNTVSVFRNTSTSGTITIGSFATKVDFTTGTNPFGVAIGDFDGDGKPDLAIANVNSNTVSLFRNTSIYGTISASSFAAKVDFTTGTGPWGVVIGDIDGDGKPDLSVTNNTGNTVSVLRNTSTSGTINSGSFSAKVDFTTGTNPQGIAIGDFDGDGKPDLAVANNSGNTVSILKNTSTSGYITAGSFITKVDFTTGTGPNVVAVGDIDGDGKPDLVVPNYTSSNVSVLRNTIALRLSITSFTPTSGAIGTAVTITGANFSTTAANNIVWFGAVKASVTAATSTSLSVTVPTGASYQPITVTVNGATAYSRFPFIVTFSTSQIIDATSLASKVDFNSGTAPYFVAISDIDGDGKPDLAAANNTSNTVSVFRNTSTSGSINSGSLATKVDFTTGTNPQGIAIGDIDGDGKPDLVIANTGSNTVSVFRNTSTSGSITAGSFATKVDFTTGTNPNRVVIGDIDGDGKPDLAVTNFGGNTVSVLMNTSTSGSITTGSIAAKVDFTTGSNPLGIAIGDIDGDGKPDLAVVNNSGTSVSVFRNTSTYGSIGTGSFAAKVDFTTGTTPIDVVISDIDGDGKPELAVSNSTANTISLFRNTSTSGSITTSSLAAKVDITTGTSPRIIAPTDVDGDGKPDLAVTNYTGTSVSLFRNTSTSGTITAGSFTAKVDFTTAANPLGVAIGDIDGDGKPDIAVINSTSNTVSLLRNTMAPAQTPPTVGTITQPTCTVPTGSVVLGGLPSSGTWTLTKYPGGTTSTGTGTSGTVTGLSPGATYTFTVTAAAGGTSVASANVVINAVPTGIVPVIKSKWSDVLICYNLKDSIATYQWYKGSSPITGGTGQFYYSRKQAGTYKVLTTDKNGCANYSNSVIISGTKSLSVYPNPARDNFAVTLTDETLGKTVITIINETGTKVMELETDKEFSDLYKVIPVTDLDKGIYFVRVAVNQVNVYYTKIVIIK